MTTRSYLTRRCGLVRPGYVSKENLLDLVLWLTKHRHTLIKIKEKAMRANRNLQTDPVTPLPRPRQRWSVCNLTLRMCLRSTIGLVSFFALCPAQSPDYTN